MSFFSLYGIKEVADVTFWTTGKDSKPVLYLDTLKVSTIEETGEQAEARGGKGNAPLIIWDYGKEITLTLEDALFSMKSMQIMQGAKKIEQPASVTRTAKCVYDGELDDTAEPTGFWAKKDVKVYLEDGSLLKTGEKPKKGEVCILTWDEALVGENAAKSQSIVISSDTFPGTYKITGDTYARNQDTGEDEFFQFIIPLAKINPEQTITMQADGDPSTFSMTVRVLRPAHGKMLELIKYPNLDLKAEAGE